MSFKDLQKEFDAQKRTEARAKAQALVDVENELARRRKVASDSKKFWLEKEKNQIDNLREMLVRESIKSSEHPYRAIPGLNIGLFLPFNNADYADEMQTFGPTRGAAKDFTSYNPYSQFEGYKYDKLFCIKKVKFILPYVIYYKGRRHTLIIDKKSKNSKLADSVFRIVEKSKKISDFAIYKWSESESDYYNDTEYGVIYWLALCFYGVIILAILSLLLL